MTVVIRWKNGRVDGRRRPCYAFARHPGTLERLVGKFHKESLLRIDGGRLRFGESKEGMVKVAYVAGDEVPARMVTGTIWVVGIWVVEGLVMLVECVSLFHLGTLYVCSRLTSSLYRSAGTGVHAGSPLCSSSQSPSTSLASPGRRKDRPTTAIGSTGALRPMALRFMCSIDCAGALLESQKLLHRIQRDPELFLSRMRYPDVRLCLMTVSVQIFHDFAANIVNERSLA